MICSRKINDEINIFEGITGNPSFLIVWTVIVVFQIVCIQLFGRFMSVHVNGLTAIQWIYCLVIALVTFPINIILKFVPDTMCPVLGEEEEEDIKIADAQYKELCEKGEEIKK
jgi:Ca2+-transporting ATPase